MPLKQQETFRKLQVFAITMTLFAAGGLTLLAMDSGTGTSAKVLNEDAEQATNDANSDEEEFVPPTKAELRRKLNRIQYDVTQNAATEPAFRNAYWNNKKKGEYHCIVCDKPLFKSDTKFKSGTGWPSFFEPIEKDAVGYETDYKMFFPRTEVHCERCKAHLGHVFDDGPAPTGKRYCMNSASMKFIEANSREEK